MTQVRRRCADGNHVLTRRDDPLIVDGVPATSVARAETSLQLDSGAGIQDRVVEGPQLQRRFVGRRRITQVQLSHLTAGAVTDVANGPRDDDSSPSVEIARPLYSNSV